MKYKPDPRKVFSAKVAFSSNFGPRHLRRSVARANLERAGIQRINKKRISGTVMYPSRLCQHWRKAAFVPSDKDVADAKTQREKDAKRRSKEKAKRHE